MNRWKVANHYFSTTSLPPSLSLLIYIYIYIYKRERERERSLKRKYEYLLTFPFSVKQWRRELNNLNRRIKLFLTYWSIGEAHWAQQYVFPDFDIYMYIYMYMCVCVCVCVCVYRTRRRWSVVLSVNIRCAWFTRSSPRRAKQVDCSTPFRSSTSPRRCRQSTSTVRVQTARRHCSTRSSATALRSFGTWSSSARPMSLGAASSSSGSTARPWTSSRVTSRR